MALLAQIKFTQDDVSGEAGQAFLGAVTLPVTIEQDTDEESSDPIGSWVMTLLSAPAASGYSTLTPLELGAADTDTPITTSLVPDVPGSYRVRLRIWGLAGQVGPSATDIRNFIVPEPKHGFVVPPYQQDPLPLPTLASGSATARPNETNLGGNEYGWMGDGTDGLLATAIKKLDASNFDIVPDPTTTGSVLTATAGFSNYNVPSDVVLHGDSTWFCNTGAGFVPSNPGGGVTRVSKTTQKITERLGLGDGGGTIARIPFFVVSSGTRLFLIYLETDNTTYTTVFAQEILVGAPGSSSFGAANPIWTEANPEQVSLSGAVYDAANNIIWFALSRTIGTSFVIGVALPFMVVGTPVTIAGAAEPVSDLILDTDTSRYGDVAQRLYTVDTVNGRVVRIKNLAGTPATDGFFVSGVPVKGALLAIGGGAAGPGGGRIYVCDFLGGGISSFSTAGTLLVGPVVIGVPVFTITYESTNDSLIVAALATNQVQIGAFDASDLATPLATPILLAPTDEATGPGIVSRYALHSGYLWAYSPSTDSIFGTVEPAGHAYRIDSVGLTNVVELLTPGTTGFQFPDRILWRLDDTGHVKTWDDVMAAVGQSKVPVSVYMDRPGLYVVEPGPGPNVIHNMKQSCFEALEGPHDVIQVQIRRGATLLDLAGISGGMRLQHNHLIGDGEVLAFSPGITPVFKVEKGATIQGLINAEIPMISVTSANPEFYLVFNELGTAHYLPGTVSNSTVDVGAGAFLRVIATTGGLGVDAPQDASWISSNAAGTISWIHDGSMYFAGNFWNGLHPFNLGTNINEALGQNGGSGPPGFEPVYQGGGSPSVGCAYWNVSTETLYVWNGVAWITPNKSVTASITASTTQTQGNGALISDVNQVSVCANANDTVTLPAAVPGHEVIVINSGANTLQVFPASGDDLGAGVNNSTTQATGVTNRYVAYDTTNWVKL